jgi:hypothetical protein
MRTSASRTDYLESIDGAGDRGHFPVYDENCAWPDMDHIWIVLQSIRHVRREVSLDEAGTDRSGPLWVVAGSDTTISC